MPIDIEYDADELAAIQAALLLADPWNEDLLACEKHKSTIKSIKQKLKSAHLMHQGNRCCYCRASFVDVHGISIDREHILPKSKFVKLTYEPNNISIACKKCNLQLKNDKIDFLTSLPVAKIDPFRVGNYLIYHPNYENLDQHIAARRYEAPGVFMLFFTKLDSDHKTTYHAQYFRFKERTRSLLDDLQGIASPDRAIVDRLMELVGD